MRFVHLTDLHLTRLDAIGRRDLRGKRLTGYWSWMRRRRHTQLRAVLDRLAETVQRAEADWLLVSGDLAQIGLEAEIREAAEWLSALAPPERILFVPGNHDVYARDSWAAIRRHWGPWLPPDAHEPWSGYPLVRETGDLLLVGASSACVTPVFSARGALGRAQRGRLETCLRAAHRAGRSVILVIHHPPLRSMAHWRKALREVSSVQALIAATQPVFAVCGHLHRNITRVQGQTRVFATASASGSTDASFRVFDVERLPAGCAVRMELRRLNTDTGRFDAVDEQRWSSASGSGTTV